MSKKQVTKNQVAAALKKARNLIKKGFAKQMFEEKNYSTGLMSYCTIGAIRKVDGPAEQLARQAIYQSIKELFYPNRTMKFNENNVYRFNDRKATKQEDVVRAFDRAIEIALEADEVSTVPQE